jgi:hypothetical protein
MAQHTFFAYTTDGEKSVPARQPNKDWERAERVELTP